MTVLTAAPWVRARQLAFEVRALLEEDLDTADVSEAAQLTEDLVEARGRLGERLADCADLPAAEVAELCEDLTELTELQGALLEHTVTLRLQAVGRIHEALSRLRSCSTVGELLPAAVEELARCCNFDRTAVSRLRGSTWRPEAIWIDPQLEPNFAQMVEEYLVSRWQPLGPGALETDLIRRRAAAVISADDPRMNHEWLTVAGSSGYVAAPVMPAGRVIGFLQADCYGSKRSLTAHDRDNMWTFAEGFGLLFERTVLLERLDTQRAKVREAFAMAEKQFEELSGDEIKLAQSERAPTLIATRAADLFRPPTTLPTGREGLTARERQVLELMATGARNSEIADRLVVSEATVKSHVKSVLRKLGANNRADAVARHLQARSR